MTPLTVQSPVVTDQVLLSYIKMYDEEAEAYRAAAKAGHKLQMQRSEKLLRWLDIRLQRDWEDMEFYKVTPLQVQ